MDRYVCTVCGYVYDPEIGDPDSGIEQEHLLPICLRIGFVSMWGR